MPGALSIGTAGFSYPDWEGPVYGGTSRRAGHPLSRLSAWVDLLEVNVSHYRIPAARTARAWLRETASRPGFRFTAKVWRGFTHGPERASAADLRAMREFLSVLGEDGRLLCALAQVPPSMRATDRARAYVLRLADHFEGVPLAFEARDVSWDDDGVRAELAGRGVAWVVADLPPGSRSVPPRPLATTPLGYVRLHGRSPAWYEPGVGRDRRYDHLYSREELAPWLERITALRAATSRVVVVTNNHFGGKAVANALELKALTSGERVVVPPSLLAAFPRLADVAVRTAGGDGTLG